jgi:hypothetical protein
MATKMYFKRVKVLFMAAPYRLSEGKGIGRPDAPDKVAAKSYSRLNEPRLIALR